MRVRILKSENVYTGRIFEVKKDLILFGKNIITRDIIKHPGSALMIPVVDIKKARIILIKQYRYAAGGEIIEFPAGTKERDETYAKCASRELVEETGYKAGKIIRVSQFYLAPGTMTELMYMFLCLNLTKVKQALEADEKISPYITTLDKAVRLVFSGKIRDAKTICAILSLKNIYQDKKLRKRFLKAD
jgi:ADP-ribose pyrophosphatase